MSLTGVPALYNLSFGILWFWVLHLKDYPAEPDLGLCKQFLFLKRVSQGDRHAGLLIFLLIQRWWRNGHTALGVAGSIRTFLRYRLRKSFVSGSLGFSALMLLFSLFSALDYGCKCNYLPRGTKLEPVVASPYGFFCTLEPNHFPFLILSLS